MYAINQQCVQISYLEKGRGSVPEECGASVQVELPGYGFFLGPFFTGSQYVIKIIKYGDQIQISWLK